MSTMEKAQIEKLAELIEELGRAGRQGAELLAAELATYPDKTFIEEGLDWLSDMLKP